MRLRHLILGLVLLASLPLSGQGYRKRLTLEAGAISNIWMCNAPGGGLYIACFRNNSSTNFALFLTKLSPTGSIVWARKSSSDRLGISVTSDPQGNIYLVYEPINNNAITGVVVEKINTNGQTVWQKKDGNSAFSLSYHALSYQNGRVFVSNNNQQKHRITAFNSSNGNVVWSQLYDSNIATNNDNIYQLLALNDGSLLASTQVVQYSSTTIVRSLIHLDKDGNFIKIKSYTGFAFVDVTELSNGNIAFSAKSTYTLAGGALADQFYIGVMTPDLEFKWVKKVSQANLQAVQGVDAVDNGAFLVCLQNPGVGCLGESIVFRSDEFGNVQWSKAVKTGAFFSIQHVAMPDNGLAWVSYNPAIDTAIIINRLDDNGNVSGCPTIDSPPFSLKDTSIFPVSLGWEISPAEPWTNTNPTVFTDIDSHIADYCPNNILDAAFTINEDTVCLKEIITATPNSNLGNPVWLFGANGSLGTQYTVGSASIAMTAAGLIPITHIRTLGSCSDTVKQNVLVKQGPVVELGATRKLCPGASTTLEASASAAVDYLWSDGSTAQSLLVNNPGLYTVKVSGPVCHTLDTVLVESAPVPNVSLGPDQSVCADDPFRIVPMVNPPGGVFSWSDGSADPTLLVTSSGEYVLTVQLGACKAADTLQVEVLECPTPKLYIPNVFAPNGSLENSRFVFSTRSVTLQNLSVYDRWGSLVCYTEQAPFEWDGSVQGKPAVPGVYTYVVRYRDEISGDLMVKSGDISLVR